MAKKASEHVKYYKNPKGPIIGTVSRKIIERDGLYFKDLDGSGEYKPYDDWRLPAKERAEAYVKVLSTDEKIAQLFISDWRMGKYPCGVPEHKVILDESGILDDAELHGKNIFGEQHLPGTTELIKKLVCPSSHFKGKSDTRGSDGLDQSASWGCRRMRTFCPGTSSV